MFFLLITAFILAGLIFGLRLDFGLNLINNACRIRLDVRFFFRVFSAVTELAVDYSPGSGVNIRPVKDWGLWRLVKRSAKSVEGRPSLADSLPSWLHVRKLSIRGDVGCADDAFITAIAASLLSETLHGGLGVLEGKIGIDCIHVDIRPEFENTVFRMNLAGIATISTARIAVELFLSKLRRTRKKYATSD